MITLWLWLQMTALCLKMITMWLCLEMTALWLKIQKNSRTSAAYPFHSVVERTSVRQALLQTITARYICKAFGHPPRLRPFYPPAKRGYKIVVEAQKYRNEELNSALWVKAE